jgi:acyl dehydratase
MKELWTVAILTTLATSGWWIMSSWMHLLTAMGQIVVVALTIVFTFIDILMIIT